MAGYRQFHTKFWKDEWLIDLEPLERYLFTYLFTNDLSSISGIYKLPYKVILNETGLEPAFVDKTLKKFEDAQKILYRDGVMWVVKMGLHHKNASPLTMKKVEADVALIGDCLVKMAYEYYKKTGEYSIDMVSIPILKSESKIEKENIAPEAGAVETPFDGPIKNMGAFQALQKYEANKEQDYSWLPEGTRPLAQAFYSASGITPTAKERGLWQMSLLQLYEMQATPKVVTEVTAKMRRNRLTLKSPQSIIANTRDYITAKTHDGEKWND